MSGEFIAAAWAGGLVVAIVVFYRLCTVDCIHVDRIGAAATAVFLALLWPVSFPVHALIVLHSAADARAEAKRRRGGP